MNIQHELSLQQLVLLKGLLVSTILEIENGRDGYVTLVDHVYEHGVRRAPRGLATLDAGFVTIVVRDPANALPLGTGRGVSPSVAAVEAIQLIAAVSVPQMVIAASPRFVNYQEPNGEFYGAYGRRIGDQVSNVIDKLKADQHSRQAVITLWNPIYDNVATMKDYPCTVALHFAIVDDMLEMNVTMRSNDVWLGTPYDLFQFTQLQMTIANVLNIGAGTYRHTAWSLHLYESDTDAIEEFISADIYPSNAFQPRGINFNTESWVTAQTRALTLINGEELHDATGSEQWYERQLAKLR